MKKIGNKLEERGDNKFLTGRAHTLDQVVDRLLGEGLGKNQSSDGIDRLDDFMEGRVTA